MKNILVMQLFRFGDILQSTPAIAALREAHPRARITVLARKAFAAVLDGTPDVDEVLEWDVESLGERVGPDAPPGPQGLARLRESLAPLRDRRFDLVCNLSNDMPSALVVHLLRPRQACGLTYCKDRRYRVRNDWMRYLFLASEVRTMNTINLADCFAQACGAGRGELFPVRIAAADEGVAADALSRLLPDPRRPVIAIQAGASKDFKQWPARRFAELGDRLIAEGRDLLFFGSADERPGIDGIFRSLSSPVGHALNLAGQTTFAELAAFMKQCRLLISNDTAAIHVAAATATPALALTFGPTSPFETSPYGEGHFVLTPLTECFPCDWSERCADVPCRELLTVDAAHAAVRCALGEGAFVPRGPDDGRLVLYRSEQMPDDLLGLRPLNRPPLRLLDLLRMIFRTHFVTQCARSPRRRTMPVWRPWMNEVLEWYRIPANGELVPKCRAAIEDFATLRGLAEMGIQAANTIAAHSNAVSAGGAWQGRLAASFRRLEERVLAAEQDDALRVLVAAFRHNLRDMETMPLRETAIVHRWNYHSLATGCSFAARALEEFIECLEEEGADDPAPRGAEHGLEPALAQV